MTVEDPDVVDSAATRPDDGGLILFVFDHLGWSDVAGHLELLSDKIGNYAGFLLSGDAPSSYPDLPPAAFEAPLINVSFAHQPPQEVVDALQTAAANLARNGIGFEFEIGLGADKRVFRFG